MLRKPPPTTCIVDEAQTYMTCVVYRSVDEYIFPIFIFTVYVLFISETLGQCTPTQKHAHLCDYTITRNSKQYLHVCIDGRGHIVLCAEIMTSLSAIWLYYEVSN